MRKWIPIGALCSATSAAAGAHAPVRKKILACSRSLEQRFHASQQRDGGNVPSSPRRNQHHRFALLQIAEFNCRSPVQHLFHVSAAGATSLPGALDRPPALSLAVHLPDARSRWRQLPLAQIPFKRAAIIRDIMSGRRRIWTSGVMWMVTGLLGNQILHGQSRSCSIDRNHRAGNVSGSCPIPLHPR